MPGSQDLIQIIDASLTKSEITATIAALQPLKEEIKAFAGISIFTKDTQGAQQFREQATQLTSALEKIRAVEQELASLRAKNSSSQKTRTDQEIADSQRVTQATRGRVAEIRSEEDAYKNLTYRARVAREEFQKLAAQYGLNSKEAKAAGIAAKELSEHVQSIAKAGGDARTGVGRYTEGIKDFAKEVLTAGAAFLGLQQGIEFVKDSIKEFLEEEKSIARFKNILDNVGRKDLFTDLSKEAKEFAESLGTIKDEEVTEVFTKLITYGKLTKNQMSELLPVIADFAQKTGRTLPEATTVFTAALEGTGKELKKEFGVNMKDGADVSERFGIIMQQLKPKVDGAALAMGPLEMGMKKSAVATEELKKQIGEEFAPTLVKLENAILTGVKGIPQIFAAVANGFAKLVDGAKQAWYQFKSIFGSDDDLNRFTTERENGKKLAEFAQSRKDVQESAEAMRKDAAKKTISDQEKELRNQELLFAGDKARYEQFKKAGTLATADGKRALDDAYRSSQIVLALREQLKSSSDKSILGNGDYSKPEKDDKPKGKKEFMWKSVGEIHDVERDYEDLNALGGDREAGLGKPGEIKGNINSHADLTLSDEARRKAEAMQQSLLDKKKLTKDLEITIEKKAVDMIETMQNAKYQNEMNRIQKQIDANNKLKETETKNIQASTLSQQEKAAAQINLDAKINAQNEVLQRQQRDVKIKEAKFDKAVAIERVVLNTALAVTNAISTGDPYTAALRAAIVSVIGAAEIATVIATPIPTYRGGTENHPGGPMIVHPGEMRIDPDGKVSMTPDAPQTLTYGKRGTQIITANEVNRMMYADMMKETAFQIDNRKDLQDIKEAIQMGTMAQLAAMRKKTNIHIHNHMSGGFDSHINSAVRN